jgi:hypothetical protein
MSAAGPGSDHVESAMVGLSGRSRRIATLRHPRRVLAALALVSALAAAATIRIASGGGTPPQDET